jgi:hypothetical protein
VFVDVEDEELFVGGASGDDADSPVFVGACPPFADGVGVGGGLGCPVVDAGVFCAGLDGDDSDAFGGVGKCFVECVHCGSLFESPSVYGGVWSFVLSNLGFPQRLYQFAIISCLLCGSFAWW